MSDYELGDRRVSRMMLARQAAESEQQAATYRAAVPADAVDRVACRAGDASCAAAHASTLSRSALGESSATRRSILRLQRQYGNRYVGQVLSRASAGEEGGGMESVERSIDQARGGGQGLDHSVRRQMESSFGADFSAVRIHTDAHADGLSRALSARAFTTGQDVFFRQGEYSPGTSGGRELLAHELTHVVQQNGDGIRRKMMVSQPGDPYEVEADQMARAVIQQEHAQSTDHPVLARQPEAPMPQDEEEKKKLNAKLDLAVGLRPLAQELMHVAQPPSAEWIRVGRGDEKRGLSPCCSSPGAAVAVQRKGPGEGEGNKAPVDNAGEPGAAPAGVGAPGAAGAQKKTVDLTLTAIYEDIPGEAKDKIKRAKGNEALWLDPLTMFSNYPIEKRSTISYGVVAGGGQKTVDTFKAPVSESAQSSGRGSVSAELKYAGDQNKSFSVTVTGIKKNLIAGAEATARKTIEREIMSFGDIDEIIATAERELNAVEKYQGAKVAISVKDSKVMDAGRTTFYYKVRNNAGIQMDLQVAPVGEKQTKYTGSTTSGKGAEDEESKKTKSSQESEAIKKGEKDTYKKTETSTETQDVDYIESVVKTLEDYVSKAITVHNELASDLSEKVIKHHEAKWGDKEESHRTAKNYTDYTKDSKHTVESGERDKENWAAKLKKGVKIAKKVTSIPYVDKVPVLGWLTRKVKGWQLDLLEEGLGLFAEEGKVNFTDTTLDEKVKSKQDIKDDTERKRDVELKEDDKTEVKRKLTEDFKSKTQEDWERHMKDVTETSKTYRSEIKKDAETNIDKEHAEDYKRDTKKDETETEKRHKDLANQTTTATFEVATTWKFTKPVVNASVTAGDAEVSHAPFPPEADELATTSVNKRGQAMNNSSIDK